MISAGAYGYPKDEALSVAVEEITRFLLDHDMTVYLVVFGHESLVTGKKLFRDIREYIDDVYAETRIQKRRENARKQLWREDEKAALGLDMEISQAIHANVSLGAAEPDMSIMPSGAPEADWKKIIINTDKGFSETLLQMIDERGMKDADCYKKANVDRRLFNKIRSNPAYQPSKPTVFAFAAALELSLPETKRLLKKAGFALTRSSGFDLVMEYCIKNRIYDVIQINEILFELDMPLLGSSAS